MFMESNFREAFHQHFEIQEKENARKGELENSKNVDVLLGTTRKWKAKTIFGKAFEIVEFLDKD